MSGAGKLDQILLKDIAGKEIGSSIRLRQPGGEGGLAVRLQELRGRLTLP